jgi:hypothetical protein
LSGLLLPGYWGKFNGLSMLLLKWCKIVWSKRSRYFLGTIQQIALTFSITSPCVKVLSKPKDKYPDFKYMCLFYFYLTFVYNCYVPTYHRFLLQRLLLKYQRAWNIWTFSSRFSRIVSNKIDTYLTSLWPHERYLFSVFRGILPAIFWRFSKKLSASAVVDQKNILPDY